MPIMSQDNIESPSTSGIIPDGLNDAENTDTESANDVVSDIEATEDAVTAEPVAVCELLCYASHYIHRSPPDNIKKILINAFTADEIFEAKKKLWCSHNQPHLRKFQNRKTTPQRNCSEANLNDIFDALFELDSVPDFTKVKFVAYDLVKLPTVQPEDLNDLSLLRKIECLEKKFNLLESSVTNNSLLVERIEERSDENQKKLLTQEKLLEAIALKQDGSAVSCEPGTSGSVSHNDSINIVSDDDDADDDGWETVDSDSGDSVSVTSDNTEDDTSDFSEDDEESGSSSSEESESGVSQDSGCPSCRDNHKNIQVSSQRKQFNSFDRRNKEQPKSYKAAVTGSSSRQFQGSFHRTKPASRPGLGKPREKRTDSDGFKVPRQHWKKQQRSTSLFVFNVPKTCSVTNIRQYVSDHDIKVIDLFQRSHPEARRKSFVLRVSSEVSENLLKSTFWPSGVRVRVYDQRGHGQ